MKNKKIKCDIYTRVSTTMQVDGYSLDAQKEKLKRYAEFQNMEIVNEYSDEGKSGKSVEGRPKLMLDTPRMVRTSSSFLHRSSASTAASASSCWALAVSARQSM